MTKKIIFILITITFILSFISCAGKDVLSEDPKELYLKAEKHFNNEKYEKARETLDMLLLNHPGNQFADDAQNLLAKSYYNDNLFMSAAAEYRRLLTLFSDSEYAEDAQFMIAMCYLEDSPRAELDQDLTNEAITLFNDFLSYYPESKYRDKAIEGIKKGRARLAEKDYKSAWLYHRLKDYESAILYADIIYEEYPESEFVKDALLIKVKSLLKLDKPTKADKALQVLLTYDLDSEMQQEVDAIMAKFHN